MESSLERIRRDIEKISEFNSTPGFGCTRFSYSYEDKKAREYLIKQMEDLGLEVTVDAIGNIRGRLEGLDDTAPVVMTGSHIDTVLHGGNFDGVVGVTAGLEAMRVLVENNIKTVNPVELIIFAEEEGSNFGSTMTGSKALIGKYSLEDLKHLKNDQGISCYEAAKNFGLDPDKVEEYVIKPNEIKAMLELHVEQSVVLDSARLPLGIVEAIAGIQCYKVEIHGISNHAGATPMNLRNDPMAGASKIISRIEKIAKEKAFPTTVATIGKILCNPNVSNIIPEKVTFTVDIRDVNPNGMKIVFDLMQKEIENISKEYGLKSNIELLSEANTIKLCDNIVDLIENIAKQNNYKYMRMNSGAVHDSVLMGEITDVGMIFVPSIDGRSHVPEENTRFEDIKLGCDLLTEAIINLAS